MAEDLIDFVCSINLDQTLVLWLMIYDNGIVIHLKCDTANLLDFREVPVIQTCQ